jgi:superfamily I DNA and/or RNA helicase
VKILNEEQNLILVKSEDKTASIGFCKYDNGKWMVKYENNNKVYTYSFDNITWLRNPKMINPENCIIYENHHPITGIVKILDFGDYIKLLFKTGFKKIYKRTQITIEETCLLNSKASSTFEYLKSIANHVSIKLDDDISFLKRQYNSLTMISPRSVLAAYLEGKPFNQSKGREHQVIFPFGFNISQKVAAEKALAEQISVIEGPPGTGKTQTILNIIANAVLNDKTVAVVSNNNSATANVLEKLQKYGVDFMAAYLGNNENKAKFFNEQSNLYPKINDWFIPHSEFEMLKSTLKESHQKLNQMLEYQNKRAVLQQEISIFKTEYEYFNQYYTASNFKTPKLKSFFKYSSDKILKILVEYKQNIIKGKITFRERLHNLFFRGIFNINFYMYPPEIIISFLQKMFYEKKIQEVKKEINELSSKLENYSFENEMREYTKRSMDLFKSKLAERYSLGGNRQIFSNDALWKNFHAFIKEYPVILSTTHSLRNSAEKNYLFDYVIIDEASQVDLLTGALALSCAKNAVIVGDVKQLPNVVPPEVAKNTKSIFDSFDLNEAYNYANHSLLSSILALYKNIPKTLLKEHYRCHPKIIGFCNQKFYNNELIILTNEQENDKPLILYKTAKGNHARGMLNQRQIDVIFNEIIPEQHIDVEKQTVGIISPYRLQANELQKVIGTQNIKADTVHKYQGRERDIMILTTVSNDIKVNDFVDNANLLNVAVSRAVEKLIVVVSDGSESWQGTNIGDLVKYIQYYNFEMIQSQVYSVFDLLYNSYSEKLLEVLKKTKKVSEYRSENLMNAVLEKVLSESEFQSYDWVLHQPLRMLIKDPAKLSGEELRYAMNMLTHTDFVIFNKLDKMPILVVEVDGHSFHANNPAQLKRDKMKDDILRKYNIPIIRMKTTESGEEERLRQKLMEILHLDTKVSA